MAGGTVVPDVNLLSYSNCENIVDKYVEYDVTLILLDVLLLRKPAYAHLLINVPVESPWKAAILLWVVEAFAKLIQQRSEHGNSFQENNSFAGVELYLNYVVAAVDVLSFLLCVLAVLSLRSILLTRSLKLLNTFFIIKAIMLANLGSVLAMPAFLWGKSYSSIFLWLGKAFVCLSSFQALRVVMVGPHRTISTLLAVALGTIVQALASGALNGWFRNVAPVRWNDNLI